MDSDRRTQRAKEIQESIRKVLLRDWDPIGVADVEEAQDEYDSYIGGVYRLLASGGSEDDIVNYLWQAEIDLGLGGDETRVRNQLQLVAQRLIGVDVKLQDLG
jgi:hypothetical protein